jgi:hypothetical protein
MPSQQDTPVFTYHTRIPVTPEQDQILRAYAILFGHVERTLFADIEKGKHAKDLKSAYLARFGITARQFNALRIQLLGKIEAIRKQIPLQIENLKTKIQYSPGRGYSHRPKRSGSVGASGGVGRGIANRAGRSCHLARTREESCEACMVAVVEGLAGRFERR